MSVLKRCRLRNGVEQDDIGIEDRVVLVIDEKRMSGNRHHAHAVEVCALPDDLLIAEIDVYVADGVAGLTATAIAAPLVGYHRDVTWSERRRAGRLRRRARRSLPGRRDRRRRFAPAHEKDRLE